MLYIHNSEIRSHGNLKSSNCLVDARFVLKISDFGLHSLRTIKDLDPGDHAYWKRKRFYFIFFIFSKIRFCIEKKKLTNFSFFLRNALDGSRAPAYGESSSRRNSQGRRLFLWDYSSRNADETRAVLHR